MMPVPSSRCLERCQRSSNHTIFLYKSILEVSFMNCLQNTSHVAEGKHWHYFIAACGHAPCEDIYAYIHKHARSRGTCCFLSWACLENSHLSPTSHHPYRVLPSLATGGWPVFKGGKPILSFAYVKHNYQSKSAGVRDGERERNTEHFLKSASMNEEASEASF